MVDNTKLPTLYRKGMLVGDGLSEEIPIDYILRWFTARQSLRGIGNRVLVLKSETASGKSTVLPPKLYSAHIGSERRGIIVTQPRVITAIKNVAEIRKHNKLTDRDIGWSTKYDKNRPARHGILSATLGTLTSELLNNSDDTIAARYKIIMVDEAHERSIDLDMTLTMVKSLLLRMEDTEECPFLILASATFDPDEYLRYFGVQRATNFIWCQGASHPIEEKWSFMGNHTASNYIESAVGAVGQICDNGAPASDILIFLPGAGEIRETALALSSMNKGYARAGKPVFSIISVDGDAVREKSIDYLRLDLPLAEQGQKFDGRMYIPVRRVILSTVVAETGLTLENLGYVIDAGYSREIEYNPIIGASGLITKPAPRSRIRQRKGRVGRRFPGVFYPLYPQYIYDKLLEVQYPDIITNDATNYILYLVMKQKRELGPRDDYSTPFDPTKLDLVTRPPAESVCAALRIVHNLGFMNQSALTKLGEVALSLPVPPMHARCILAAYQWGASITDVVSATAYSVVFRGANKIRWDLIGAGALPGITTSQRERIRLMICDEFIDGVLLYRALENNAAAAETDLREYCIAMGVSYQDAVDFIELVSDILAALVRAELKVNFGRSITTITDGPDFMEAVSRIKHCIYDGFNENLLVYVGADRRYMHVRNPRTRVLIPGIIADTAETKNHAEKFGAKIQSPPIFLVADFLSIKEIKNKYELIATRVSALDGFLSPDLTYGR